MRLSRIADRVARGSHALWERRIAALAGWVRAGRREDLTGWQNTLGPALRLALLAGLGYVAWAMVRARPWLMWLITGLWCLYAWRAGRPAAEPHAQEPEDDEETPAPVANGEAIRGLLLDLIGTGSAVHLSTVLKHLQERPDTAALTASWEIAELRARLEALGIPVHPKVKAGGKGPTRGVRRADLTPSPTAAEETSTGPSSAS